MLAAGVLIESCLSPGFIPKIIYILYRVEPQRDCDARVAYGVMEGPGNLKKTAVVQSACCCRSNCVCVVCVWYVWVVWACVFVHKQILQLYPDERL